MTDVATVVQKEQIGEIGKDQLLNLAVQTEDALL